MKSRKEFLIIFADPYLAYSPSTLNLFSKLKENHNVELISGKQRDIYISNRISDTNIKYIDFSTEMNVLNVAKTAFSKLLNKLLNKSKKAKDIGNPYNPQTRALISFIKKTEKEIIAVDFKVLWCVQQAGKQAHLLSLEVNTDDLYFKLTQVNTVKSLIIQSEERLDYLFPGEKPPYFFVQNSPDVIDFVPDFAARKKTDLLYCGSSIVGFGIITCLDFLKDYKEYTLTVKGPVDNEIREIIADFYQDLVDENRLIIESDYLTQAELTRYLSKFRIGFAFYDFYRFSFYRAFNFFSAPSGKVYQYLNSGVPVIGNYLSGFKFIEQNNCGKLISHLSTKQIKAAIDAIEEDYLLFAENAKKLSYEYDFQKMVQPFLEYIDKENP
jgi:hypothetical protein